MARGAKRALIVGDMPFGSYEVTEEAALTNAFRFVKEVCLWGFWCWCFVVCTWMYVTVGRHDRAGANPHPRVKPPTPHNTPNPNSPQGFVDAVKIEGGRDRAGTVRKIVKGGIAVMGHVGLTPQAISVLGGFRAQGRCVLLFLYGAYTPHLAIHRSNIPHPNTHPPTHALTHPHIP